MALSELQQIIVDAENLRPTNHTGRHDDAILELIIRLAREVDDVLRTATR